MTVSGRCVVAPLRGRTVPLRGPRGGPEIVVFVECIRGRVHKKMSASHPHVDIQPHAVIKKHDVKKERTLKLKK